MENVNKVLSPEQKLELLKTLKERFDRNPSRHTGLGWSEIEGKLNTVPDKLWTLYQMEITGGEPDVVKFENTRDEIVFVDCSPETPKARRSICYDTEALESRKENKPLNSAMQMASDMGIDVLDEEQYRALQKLGSFDLKTSSWLKTPTEIRKLGGAIFGDLRYGRVFVYHNGAESYYGARAFRGLLKI